MSETPQEKRFREHRSMMAANATQPNTELVKKVIAWCYKEVPLTNDQLEHAAWQFNCDSWHREEIDWGHRLMALDPLAYEPNEGATHKEELALLLTNLRTRIRSLSPDIHPDKGRRAYLETLRKVAESYIEK